jgi:hypothetical protein
MVSCNVDRKSVSRKKKTENQVAVKAEKKINVTVDNRTLVKVLTINGIELAYNPLTLTHKTLSNSVLVNSFSGEKIAEVKAVALDDSRIVDETGANPIVSVFGKDEKLEIEIFDISKSLDLLRHNLHDSIDTNKGTLNNGVVSIEKKNKNSVLKNFVNPPFEAPVQNLLISQVFTDLTQIGTSQFWSNDKLSMVKANSRTTLASAEFTTIDSIDLTNSRSADFKINYSVSEIDSNYEKFEMIVKNEISAGAFVTSNPVSALGNACSGKINHELIRGERIENGIQYSVAFKKGYLKDCLKTPNDLKTLFIYDESLNKLEIKFNK